MYNHFPELKGPDGKFLVAIDAWTVTATPNTKGEAFYKYVTKDATKIDGPWTDKDEELSKFYGRALKIFNGDQAYQDFDNDGPGAREQTFNGPQPWMKEMLLKVDPATNFHLRSIHVVVDPDGENAKSLLCKYFRYNLKYFLRVPGYMDSTKEIMQFCLKHMRKQHWPQDCNAVFAFDLPRAMKESGAKDVAKLCTAFEEIKNGEFTDGRYGADFMEIDNPGLVLFTNDFPALAVKRGYITHKKWKFWSIGENKTLQPYKYTPPPKESNEAKPIKRMPFSILAEPDDSDEEYFEPPKRRRLLKVDDEESE
jgi:hypothetical protein